VALWWVALAAMASATAIGPQPCDLYAAGGTPCVAAHSTTRALYAGYRGPLYEVERASDNRGLQIKPLADGYADAAAQDAFCASTTCIITRLFDQSPKHNDLAIAGPGGNGGQDTGVVANRLPVLMGGHKVYGMFFEGMMGYRDNQTDGIATSAQPESMYMVTSGTHYNDRCCFDYGNAETNSRDTGNGHMDALYFGADCFIEWPVCYGRGPWVQADLENGLFMSNVGAEEDPDYTGNTTPFVTAMLKNNGVDRFDLKNADAQRGPLYTHWSGPLPASPLDNNPPSVTLPSSSSGPGPTTLNPPFVGYSPMHKEGAIILGTGGDNTNAAVGSFFEGVMTSGYATNATEAAVQGNIVDAGYRAASQAVGRPAPANRAPRPLASS
jgi:non-reducing end alpha-L-arabinofuranosidase